MNQNDEEINNKLTLVPKGRFEVDAMTGCCSSCCFLARFASLSESELSPDEEEELEEELDESSEFSSSSELLESSPELVSLRLFMSGLFEGVAVAAVAAAAACCLRRSCDLFKAFWDCFLPEPPVLFTKRQIWSKNYLQKGLKKGWKSRLPAAEFPLDGVQFSFDLEFLLVLLEAVLLLLKLLRLGRARTGCRFIVGSTGRLR